MKPFLKYPGNKRSVFDQIVPYLPSGNRFIEPFCGSCAVSLATDYKEYWCNDKNGDLIRLYQQLASNVHALIDACNDLFVAANNRRDAFDRLKGEFNQKRSTSIRLAALLVYLNRHGFNGLMRYNSSGIFNVPFGRYDSPSVPVDGMKGFSGFASKARFTDLDWRLIFEDAKRGDVVYCDPPYVPESATANFTGYSGRWTDEDTIDLDWAAMRAAARGVIVRVSNNLNDGSTELMENAKRIIPITASRSIAASGGSRGAVTEGLFLY